MPQFFQRNTDYALSTLLPNYNQAFHKLHTEEKQTLTYMSGEIIEAAHHYENHNCHFELGGHLM